MCTSIAFSQYALYGRNLDLECGFGEQVAIAPRNQAFSFHHREPLREHYAMIGMASMAGNTPLFAEAANEKGLYIAGLNFPGNAHYFPEADALQLNLAPYELIPLLLGACATLAEARALLETVRTALPATQAPKSKRRFSFSSLLSPHPCAYFRQMRSKPNPLPRTGSHFWTRAHPLLVPAKCLSVGKIGLKGRWRAYCIARQRSSHTHRSLRAAQNFFQPPFAFQHSSARMVDSFPRIAHVAHNRRSISLE